jgi:26S proteasome regulatory subunit N1
MVAAEGEQQDCLKYCKSGTMVKVEQWGQEYLRSLAGDVAKETQKRFKESDADNKVDFSDLLFLIEVIVPYNMNHNSESEAVDFLMELDKIELVSNYTNDHNYERVCAYLLACAPYSADFEESQKAYLSAYTIYMKQKKHCQAIRVAMKMNDQTKYTEILTACKDPVERKQLGFLIGRQRAAIDPAVEIEDDLREIISNSKLSEHFKQLARDLDVLEPKTAEQTLKTHLEERKVAVEAVDSAKENLATTYVNGFVNAAFCKDLLMTVQEGDNWVHKNKDHGMMAASASLGMLMLWDIDQGLTEIDKYTNAQNEYIVAGSYIAIGIVNSGIQNECDPVYAILHEALIEPKTKQIAKIGALIGLSLTYAGSKREDLLEDFTPMILDPNNSIELQAIAALSIGLVFVGSCNEDAAQSILQTLMEREAKDLEHPFAKLFSLGLGLLFLGEEDLCEASLEACGVLGDENFAEYTKLVIDTMAYSGTGNVLKI